MADRTLRPFGSRLRRTRLALVTASTALVATALLATAPAEGHEGRHDFESVISDLTPARLAAGIELRMLDYDEQVELVNRSEKPVVVMGYDGEPYARIEPRGPVYLNLRSPALAVSNDRWGRTPPSGDEDASAAPEWVQVGDEGRLTWFDRRTHYRQAGMPPQVEDAGERTKIRDYRIPVEVGGETARIRGALFWAGRTPFPTAAFLALLLATAGATFFAAAALKRLRDR